VDRCVGPNQVQGADGDVESRLHSLMTARPRAKRPDGVGVEEASDAIVGGTRQPG
jgi:hypothetical protein